MSVLLTGLLCWMLDREADQDGRAEISLSARCGCGVKMVSRPRGVHGIGEDKAARHVVAMSIESWN